jgi:thioredoxin-dependent peroxiredoxin
MECKALRDSAEALSQYDIAFFAASVDDLQTNTRFAEELELNYPILSDPEKTTAAEYGVLNDSGTFAQRWTFYIDKTGRIIEIDKEVKPASAGEDLVATLQRLGLGR